MLELSLYSLSLILLDTQSFLGELLEEFWIVGVLEKEGKGRARKCKRTSGLTTTMGFVCRYGVSCIISLIFFTCMAYACGFLVMIYHWHGGIPGLMVDLLSLAIFWITMVLWVSFLFFSSWFSYSFGCGMSY